MTRKRGFTLIELLVVIAIIALLMSILMPALNRVKKQARCTACLANLKNWGLIFSLYCQDNDGYFFTGEMNGSRSGMGSGEFWRETMRPYSKDIKMWLCPQATKTLPTGGIPAGGWAYYAWETANDVGSYGLNGWILNIKASQSTGNRDDGWGRADTDSQGRSRHWGAPATRYGNQAPVFTGSWWVDSWPLATDQPPQTPDGPGDTPGSNEMNRVCVDRHDGFVNSAFQDWSSRKVGLKELWTLKWHRTYNVRGPWTKAGGVAGGDWPQWMHRYKDY
jgi:prepilin-type N-terminal cleavage/methylation domain-containing protein